MTLKVLNAKGAASNVAGGRLRVLNAKGAVTTTSPGRLRILNAHGDITLASLAITPFAAIAVDSFDIVQIVPTPAPGSPTPDSYSYALIPNSDVHTLEISPDGTFVAPGRINGCTVSIAVTAHQGASTAVQTASFVVARHNDFIRRGGVWVAIGPVQLLHPNKSSTSSIVDNGNGTFTLSGYTDNGDGTFTIPAVDNGDGTFTIQTTN